MDARIIPDQVGDRRPGMTRVFVSTFRSTNTTSRSRGLICPRFARDFLTLPSEGAENAGRPMRPIAACAMSVVERTRVSQVTPESPGTPRAMVLRLISCSPRRPGFLATVARAPWRELDASVGASGPHVSAVRMPALSSLAPPASTASRPASVTIASRPSEWDGMGESIVLLPPRRQEQFLKFRNKPEAHGLGASARPVAASRGATARQSSGDLICPSGNQSSPAMTSATPNDEAAELTAALPVRHRPCKRWRHRCLSRERHLGGACSSMVRAGRS
jgi:hypothetical protein